MEFSIYCDESCHLEHDAQPVMLFGALRCPSERAHELNQALREVKRRHGANGELKWVKVSPAKLPYYLELVDLFFGTPELSFRSLVVDDKTKLNHDAFNQGSHDSFYYKMYYYLLRPLVSRVNTYAIYVDIKDTRSQDKIDVLRQVLSHGAYDFENVMLRRIQHVRSHEIELLQLTDFLLGAVAYQARNLSTSGAKSAVVNALCVQVGQNLKTSTPPWEEKFNLFYFTPRDAVCR